MLWVSQDSSHAQHDPLLDHQGSFEVHCEFCSSTYSMPWLHSLHGPLHVLGFPLLTLDTCGVYSSILWRKHTNTPSFVLGCNSPLELLVLSWNSYKRALLQVALSQNGCLADSAHTTACISCVITATALQQRPTESKCYVLQNAHA